MIGENVAQWEVDRLLDATYEIVTITPYAKAPTKITYQMSQAELTSFIEGYSEFAEFIISVKEIK